MIRIDTDFPHEFAFLYNKFNATPKGKEFLELSGISRDKLDIATISKQYFENHTSDVSIDPNANVGQIKNLNTFTSEVTKGLLKLDGYFLLWKYLEKLFGLDEANRLISSCIDGKFYPHDLTKINVPYCVAVSTYNIMLCGRPYGTLTSIAPKRSSSFIAQCIEHVMSMSQEFAGAVAFGDLLVNYAWFINKESNGIFENKKWFGDAWSTKIDHEDPHVLALKEEMEKKRSEEIKVWNKKIENDFQSFVHIANNNFRIGGDSIVADSNINIYTKKKTMIKSKELLNICL